MAGLNCAHTSKDGAVADKRRPLNLCDIETGISSKASRESHDMTVISTIARNILKDEFTVNGITANDEILPDVLGLSNGGFVVAYQQTGAQPRIAVDFYNAQFNDLLGTNLIGSVTAAGQPSLTQLTNDNVLVVWEEDQPGDAGLRGQIYSPTGSAVGGLLTLNTSTTDPSFWSDPQVIALPGGGFAFAATVHVGSNGDEVVFNTFDSAGNPIHPGGILPVVNQTHTGDQNDPSVAAVPGGQFLVTYTDHNAAQPEIHAVLYNADGSFRLAVTYDITDSNTQSKSVGMPNGGIAVVYVDTSWAEGGATGAGISLRVPLHLGTIHVNETSIGDESDPEVAVLSNGYVLVTWIYPTGAGNHDVRGRLFQQDGSPVAVGLTGEEFTITSSPTDDTHAALGTMGSGRLVSVWQDSFSDGDGGRIGAKIDEFVRTSIGNSANDIFVSDGLRDIFTGGGGDNRFVFAPGGGSDSITDFVAGAGTPDKIDLHAFANIHTMSDLLIVGGMDGSGNFLQTIGLGSRDSVTLINPTGSLTANDFIFHTVPTDLTGDAFSEILFRNNTTGDTGYTDVHHNAFVSLGGSLTALSVAGSGDYNGDNFSDILFRNNSTGDTGYTDVHNNSFISLGGSPAALSVVGSGDYNGDGFSDILFRNNSTGDTGYTDVRNHAFVSLGGSPAAWTVVGSGDYNSDNFSDILFRNNATGDIGYTDIHNNVFHSLGGSPVAWSVVGSGDYNGDDFSDILFRNNATGDTGYTDIHNNAFHSLGGSPAAYSVVASGDYNGDNFSDILFRNNATGDSGYTDVHNNVFHSLGGSPAAYLVVA
jgi:hypothetical protein